MGLYDGFWTQPPNYQCATEANIRAAVAKVEAQRKMPFATVGDDRPAEWTDAAQTVWRELVENMRGESK